jgi:hypothetical protein
MESIEISKVSITRIHKLSSSIIQELVNLNAEYESNLCENESRN